MKIESITVGYGITQSLPDYCNIKPSITLTARIEDGDDALKVEQFLFDHAKVVLHELVDRALEADGIPARYALGPRFQLVKTRYDDGYSEKIFPEQCIALIPDACERPSGYVGASYRGCTHLRYEHAVRQAGELAKELEVAWIDCSDGDLSRLPVWQARDKEKEADNPDRAEEGDVQDDDIEEVPDWESRLASLYGGDDDDVGQATEDDVADLAEIVKEAEEWTVERVEATIDEILERITADDEAAIDGDGDIGYR